MLTVQNFAQAQNPRQAILCRCKISRPQLRSVEFFGGADGGAKSVPRNLARITPAQIPMPHAETHNLISLQDRLQNGAASLVA